MDPGWVLDLLSSSAHIKQGMQKHSAAKASFKCWLRCLGLCVAFSAAGGITCAVEGARTRSLGHGGLLDPGEQLELHVEGNRKPAKALESRWRMHVSQSLRDVILKYNQLK